MKQHITPSQAKEITEEQFYKLFKNQHWECVHRKDWADYHHKKVTIGKMIEILITNNVEDLHYIFDIWFSDIKYGQKSELCDTLWEEIKSIL